MTGDCENIFEGHSDTVWSMIVFKSNHVTKLASGDNKYLRIWDFKKMEHKFEAHSDRIYKLLEYT
jgi:hypothetical protein